MKARTEVRVKAKRGSAERENEVHARLALADRLARSGPPER